MRLPPRSVAEPRPVSHGREAAIDEQERARHERRVVGREKQDTCRDFLGRTHGTGLDHRVIQPDPGVVDEDIESAEAIRSVLSLTTDSDC